MVSVLFFMEINFYNRSNVGILFINGTMRSAKVFLMQQFFPKNVAEVEGEHG
jgi:hypothetical protein